MRQGSAFDTVAVIDWSGGGDRGSRPCADAIWAGCVRDGRADAPLYLRSRAVAWDWLTTFLEGEARLNRRSLVCFDFPFAPPAGLTRALTGAEDSLALWDLLAARFDDLREGEDRFHVAAGLNALFPGEGPFWFNGRRGDIPGLPRRKPATLPPGLARMRKVETLAPGTFAIWQMGGQGAVGSQALTGMAFLSRLRRRLAGIRVWPFQPDEGRVLLAEVWPSLLRDDVRKRSADPALPPIRDAVQVAVLSQALWRMQVEETLAGALAAGGEGGGEGWILGVGAEDALRRAARVSSCRT
ncbi:molybdopterin biosynthesis protein MoeA [Oceaniovalibus guishaninsula JLT2003]|uniref:Molybdopterin biosynthesis protein MoeA n=1 Tax=Oceaniovalibus guishaninsula JLT2003 TaxID=1231392 RepID=K2HAP9_9RHOB|nr:hypothetical protein [Oceaniovalibus guishaninsula]EKE43742.1 molybdopterin biosynthesis protein MoeA [Oceaniovalibus guishaninsula JLT2003]